jgi:outer membrane receptor protein involved in Fe transport
MEHARRESSARAGHHHDFARSNWRRPPGRDLRQRARSRQAIPRAGERFTGARQRQRLHHRHLVAAAGLHLTLSGRYNATRVRLQDTGPSAPALDGSHSYNKFNPAAGLAYQVSNALTLYGGFSQGNRAPTPIELGCADPARPCTLPNALAADPPLQQVVAQTWELGVRGVLPGNIRWNAGLFQATNTNDILFVGTTTSAGYFTNFGKTRRRGLELGLSGAAGRWQWSASYSFVRATFQSSACIVSENNSSRGTSSECSPEDP